MSDDVIVIGKPEETTDGLYAPSAIVTGSGMAGTGPARQIRENQTAAANSVTIDSDAEDQDVVVIASRMKQNNLNILMQLTPGRDFILPCIGVKSSAKLRSLALALRFRVTTENYGTGRAGENIAKSGTNITVNINKDALKIYDTYPGGLTYLSLHEMAHSFKEMRDFNKSQFEAYSRGAGAGKSYNERNADYPNSPEFAENEARANAIAKAISEALNGLPIGFNPRYGTTTNC